MFNSGDIILSKTNTIFGFLIRTITNSDTSHVSVVLDENNCIEATPSGVEIKSLDKYQSLYIEVYRFNLSQCWIDSFVNEVKSQLNRPYDWFQVLSIGVFLISSGKLRPDWSSKKRAICSEIVYEAAERANLPTPPEKKAFFTPKDCSEWPLLKRVL